MYRRGKRRIYAIYPDSVKSIKRIWKLRCTCRIRFLIRFYCNGNKNVTKMNKKLHLWLKEKRISVILLQRILKFLWSRGASMRNCNKKKKRRGLFILVLLAFMLLWSPFLGETGDSLLGVHTVQAATRHVTARYWSTDG